MDLIDRIGVCLNGAIWVDRKDKQERANVKRCIEQLLGDDNLLLEFKVKNYKSFVDEASFSMMAAPRQTGLDYSLLRGIRKFIINFTRS